MKNNIAPSYIHAGPLAWFFVTLIIILVGCGQAFYMAFGLHLPQFRNFFMSVTSLLRMAIGDFDYAELEESQMVLGPLLFWAFIIRPRRLGAATRPSRFPLKVHFAWGFCVGAQGA